MKKFLKPAALVAITIFTLASCKKEETPNPGNNGTNTPPAPTKTELITSKTWKLSSATLSPAVMGETDYMKMIKDCDKDNTLKFNADKTLVIDNGSMRCNAMDPQTFSKTWALNTNETVVSIGSSSFNLVDVNTSALKLSHSMTYNGTNYTVTEVYSGQ